MFVLSVLKINYYYTVPVGIPSLISFVEVIVFFSLLPSIDSAQKMSQSHIAVIYYHYGTFLY